ncbi:uncharacterized protein LOC131850563 [Achroia grisella]|uniref:uncharacterized protein LOC131850563 n=1 Tax=Achroia grisella TaxID=688607 RepID=UPI0027D2CAA1|nr:uncharacterized protein LOC131850563 [Achroia grisella]
MVITANMSALEFKLFILFNIYLCIYAERNIYFNVSYYPSNIECYYLEGEHANIVFLYSKYINHASFTQEINYNSYTEHNCNYNVSFKLPPKNKNKNNIWFLQLLTNKDVANNYNKTQLYNGSWYAHNVRGVHLEALAFPTVSVNSTKQNLTVLENQNPYIIDVTSVYNYTPSEDLQIECEYKSNNLINSTCTYCSTSTTCTELNSERKQNRCQFTLENIQNGSKIICYYKETDVNISVTVHFNQKKLDDILRLSINNITIGSQNMSISNLTGTYIYHYIPGESPRVDCEAVQYNKKTSTLEWMRPIEIGAAMS